MFKLTPEVIRAWMDDSRRSNKTITEVVLRIIEGVESDDHAWSLVCHMVKSKKEVRDLTPRETVEFVEGAMLMYSLCKRQAEVDVLEASYIE